MSTSEALEKYGPFIIVGLLVVLAVYVYSTSSGTQGTTVIPGQNNTAAQSAADQTNAQLAAQHEQNILGGFTSLVDLARTQDTNATQLGEAQIAGRVQSLQSQETTAAQVTVSNNQLEATQAQANAVKQAATWNGIASIFGAATKLIPLSSYRATSNTLPAVGSIGPNVSTAGYAA